ncbi:MAG: single-strand DNA-binding [Planctomycetota bacterium]|nr:MAG: single-strand DNA-binding [Planctomycetota bacterium]
MHFNKVIMIGTVVRDPEIRFAGPNQVPVTDIRMACNRVWKSEKGEKREETLFIDVTAWARSAEIAVQYLRKGRHLAIEGHLKMEEWLDKEGKKASRVKIVSDRLMLLPQGNGAHNDSPAPGAVEGEPSHEEEEARIPA